MPKTKSAGALFAELKQDPAWKEGLERAERDARIHKNAVRRTTARILEILDDEGGCMTKAMARFGKMCTTMDISDPVYCRCPDCIEKFPGA